ncbi:UNVERIFIED_CONTAM: hypothetical protein K2H54_044624 [Gekko kuhli]
MLLAVILTPFIIPLCILIFVYLTSFFCLIYQRTHKLQEDCSSNNLLLTVANKWDQLARFWNGRSNMKPTILCRAPPEPQAHHPAGAWGATEGSRTGVPPPRKEGGKAGRHCA